MFSGVGCAVVTPFRAEDYSLDEDALAGILEHLIQGGLEYIVLQGTTGETPVLSPEEKKRSLELAVEVVNKRKPLVLGISGNHTEVVKQDLQRAQPGKVDGILSAAPAYNKPNQRGLYAHYQALAGATELPIILYNVPGRTACNISAETTLGLAHNIDNIVAIKEASANFKQCSQILAMRPRDFTVLSGEDSISLPLIALGMEGVISVTANAFPYEFSEMVRRARRGDLETAQHYHYALMPFMELAFADGNPAGIKRILHEKGLCQDVLRLPLVSVEDEVAQSIRQALEDYHGVHLS